MMMELILTRPSERQLVESAQGLRFLVLDELHTYRGRQGADVAMLVRRTREACRAESLQCIGTSATLTGPGTFEDQKKEIAAVAEKLFGAPVDPNRVIGETLRRATPEADFSDSEFVEKLKKKISDTDSKPLSTYPEFISDPLSIWIESTFGMMRDQSSGKLIRTPPKSITGPNGAARDLSQITGVEENRCVRAIQKGLLAGYRCKNPDTHFPAFAFRLHQFISRGDHVYASLEPPQERYITVNGQQFVPGDRTNPFFVSFYQAMAAEGKGIEAKEHTAQVSYEERVRRETDFKEGRLPILYCSPTMEPGIDIATLNVVNMRNIPPTPANYAQRSGRAGRSGQPALVFSYCTTGSPHDQYFFKRPDQMVAGAVAPPKLELANEDLIKTHVHAIWLAATGQSLGSSLRDVLDLFGDNPSLEILESVKEAFNSDAARKEAFFRSRRILSTLEKDIATADWYSDTWLEDVLNKVFLSFEQACERWRSLYRAAARQREYQNKIIGDATRTAEERQMAKRLRREAESQLELLLESANVIQSDFYSYRYFASEGFLPGYNFPRLPLSAYIPGRRRQKDEFLSRPCFLAISEFGPRSIIYHEGSRYIVNKVILPVGDVGEDEILPTASAKLCPKCGYLHPIPAEDQGPDLCEYCNQLLDLAITPLFRLQNATTKRRDRINCDEEERLRLGYEIKSGVRFTMHGGKPNFTRAALKGSGTDPVAVLTYGHSATLWRINLGWVRRKEKNKFGFVLVRSGAIGPETSRRPRKMTRIT